MNFLSMLGGVFNLDDKSFGTGFGWLLPIVKFIDNLLIPITIILVVVGAVWVIFLGVGLAKADSADKAQEAKKRLINVAVAMVATIVFVWLLAWFASQVPTLFGSNQITSAT